MNTSVPRHRRVIKRRVLLLRKLIEVVTGLLEKEGYSVIAEQFNCYNRTVKLVIEKDGATDLLPLIENFWDGEVLHGTLNICDTAWFKKAMAESSFA